MAERSPKSPVHTTIDIQESLMRAAKARAAERGESLKDLVDHAVTHELGMSSAPPRKSGRVTLPLIGGTGPAVLVTNEDIEAAFDADMTLRKLRTE
jgi:hypothetical protein